MLSGFDSHRPLIIPFLLCSYIPAQELLYCILVRDFNRNNNSGRGRSFGGGNNRGFNNRGFDRPRTMHPAVCSNCGKQCEVPFKPTGEKPVLCRDCFRESGGGEARRPEERNFSRPSNQSAPTQHNEYKAQLDALTQKVDAIFDILTKAVSTQTPAEATEEIAQEPVVEKKKRSTKKAL